MNANAEIIAELRRVLNERDEARRERDSYQRQLDAIGDAVVTSITKRIEPRISRHPVTVVMAAGSLIAKIGEAIGCEFEDGDDLLEAVKGLVRERDEARADAERYLADLRRCASEPYERTRELEALQAEVERLRTEVASSLAMARIADEKHGWKCAEVDMLRGVGCMEDGDGPCGVCRKCAYRRGAEAMREACARWMSEREGIAQWVYDDALSALPIPGEP